MIEKIKLILAIEKEIKDEKKLMSQLPPDLSLHHMSQVRIKMLRERQHQLLRGQKV